MANMMRQVERLQRVFPAYNLTPMIVQEAMRAVRDHQLPYYDAQIWAAARLNQVPVICSENFHHGVLEGVQIANPFAPDFAVESWLAP